MTPLLWLAVIGAQLSLIAIGGASAVIPELHRQVVDVHHWMGSETFAALFAMGQAAPGPNVLVMTLIGWQVAGVGGAVVATLAMLLPSSTLTWFVGGAWHRFRDRPWRKQIQAGLVPVTVGLVMAAAVILCVGTTINPVAGAITAAVALATLRTKLHPLWLLGGGALLGVLGLV